MIACLFDHDIGQLTQGGDRVAEGIRAILEEGANRTTEKRLSNAEKEKYILDFLCANHTRGLPITHFNKLANDYLKEFLGDYIDATKAAGFARELNSVARICYMPFVNFVMMVVASISKATVVQRACHKQCYTVGELLHGSR